MLDATVFTGIAMVFLPFLVDLLIRLFKVEATLAKKIVAIVLSGLIAVVVELYNKPFTTIHDFALRFSAILVASQVIFSNFYKDTSAQKVMLGK